ncbi:MAG: TonB-dependent receptor [Prolixibacteraceae bacterium]|jgi:outer membrane cobalamin receptor|nr:TonB-dependent receptor [Prolixibacteraceae bacterium]
MHKLFITIIFTIFGIVAFSQARMTLSGRVTNAETGEDLIGATVYVEEIKRGAATNTYGFYSLSLDTGKYTFVFSYLGFESQQFAFDIRENQTYNVALRPADEQIDEIVVRTEAINQNITSAEMGTVKLDPSIIKSIPVIFGEQDILKTIQLMPGVNSAGEGSSGFFVRGGQADQNLVLIDNAPVFNPSHLLGFFSVFNSDAINSAKLYKGGVPAQYGGRASSVLDVSMREGNSERFAASGGIGLISSRLTLEGPLLKNGSSFLISGRRTYADLFLLFSKNESLRESKLYFYDLNLKAHIELGPHDRIYMSGYLGRDALKTSMFGFDWGNKVATVRYTHVFSSRLFSNTSLIFNDYDYKTNADFDFSFDLSAGIIGNTFKQKFTFYASSNNTLDFGVEANDFNFKPGNLETVSLQNEPTVINVPEKQGTELAVYISNKQLIGDNVSLNYGLRVSSFYRYGEGNDFKFDSQGNVVDSLSYQKGDRYDMYLNWEPRFSATYVFNDNSSIKAGFNRMAQYIHLLQNSSAGTPVDFWTPSSVNIKPQIADQVSFGFFRNFQNHEYKFSIETYYKSMKNQIDYKTGASLLLNDMVEAELLYGKGRAYGVELLLEKQQGRFTGWMSYTLSRSERQIEGINRGVWYPSRQDRLHDLSVVAVYKWSPRWTFSANWVYNTGTAVTLPAGKYYIDGTIANLYTERNGYRLPDYHRMDLGATWLLSESKTSRSELNFSIYNAYARKNPYSYVFGQDEDNPDETKTTMIYLFSAIPSVSWNFKF